ncbi:MAG: hypothetical protein R2706_04700 [Acidimicrobiales bacterium]
MKLRSRFYRFPVMWAFAPGSGPQGDIPARSGEDVLTIYTSW